jgi:hypothetical protein
MENEEKVKTEEIFPFTARQEKERSGKDFHPSFSGQGHEEVEIERFDIFNQKERGGSPGVTHVKIKDVAMFLTDQYREAAEHGRLIEVYSHYTEQFTKVKAWDEKTASAFRKFLPEVQKAYGFKEQTKLFEEAIGPYLGKLAKQKI